MPLTNPGAAFATDLRAESFEQFQKASVLDYLRRTGIYTKVPISRTRRCSGLGPTPD
jgi:hypothetical protein